MIDQKPPSWNSMRDLAQNFALNYKDETDENAESQAFWIDFLNIFGIDRKRVKARFEAKASRSSTGGAGRFDMFWPGVLAVEHKSRGQDLEMAEQQCLDYLDSVPDIQWPQAVVTSDFARVRIMHLGGSNNEKRIIEFELHQLPDHIEEFAFLLGREQRPWGTVEEKTATIQAAKLMGELYEEVAATGYDEHQTSVLLVRLLFLLFGDDAGLWQRGLFSEFIATRTSEDGTDLGAQINHLFEIADLEPQKRLANTDEVLMRLPYINGELFAERLTTPAFTKAMRTKLLQAGTFNWRTISPAIFGSLFQTIKSREARAELGEHYTSEENILKVINPLFMDELNSRFHRSFHDAKQLLKLQQDLGELTFIDPACGCGNFLVVTYRELRELELQILIRLRELDPVKFGQLETDVTLNLNVSPNQFYGIEIIEWPSQIAKVAMFLIDHLSNMRLAETFGQPPNRLPIKTAAIIVNANALQTPWDEVLPTFNNKTYIISNPPFVGSLLMSDEQKEDAKHVWGNNKRLGTMDYVTNWFVLSSRLIDRYDCVCGLVATNSVSQGEQVAALWGELNKSGVAICFAHQTFAWSNEAPGEAAVHVVIIGLAQAPVTNARLFTYADIQGPPQEVEAKEINPYLVPGKMVVVQTRGTPLNVGQVQMRFGSMPRDGGWLSKIDAQTASEIRSNDPIAAKYLRKLIGSEELLNGGERYCLWLLDAEPSELRTSPTLKDRLEKVRAMRAASKAPSTRKWAAQPGLFVQNGQPSKQYLAVPRVSSETRAYVPMAFFEPDVIASDALLTIEQADLFTFGLLQSRVFSAWNARVSGRLESRFRVSAEITYHNFPYPNANEEQRLKVSECGKAVLLARQDHPRATLAELYAPAAMPSGLHKAHAKLDAVVLQAYGIKGGADETQILERLFKRYEALMKENKLDVPQKRPNKKTNMKAGKKSPKMP